MVVPRGYFRVKSSLHIGPYQTTRAASSAGCGPSWDKTAGDQAPRGRLARATMPAPPRASSTRAMEPGSGTSAVAILSIENRFKVERSLPLNFTDFRFLKLLLKAYVVNGSFPETTTGLSANVWAPRKTYCAPHNRPAMLTVPSYGCASRTKLATLATVF